MSLRDPSHQSAIELGEMDTEYVSCLKQERKILEEERNRINRRLERIEELLAK